MQRAEGVDPPMLSLSASGKLSYPPTLRVDPGGVLAAPPREGRERKAKQSSGLFAASSLREQGSGGCSGSWKGGDFGEYVAYKK